MTELFKAAHPPWLTAVGDGTQLVVSRSLAMSVHDERYLAVEGYIADHQMVLVDSKTGPEEGMYGRVYWSRYATPEARNLIRGNEL